MLVSSLVIGTFGVVLLNELTSGSRSVRSTTICPRRGVRRESRVHRWAPRGLFTEDCSSHGHRFAASPGHGALNPTLVELVASGHSHKPEVPAALAS